MTQLAEAFDTDQRIIATYKDASSTFENWAAIGGNELPADAVDAMQVKLMRWQRAKFGDQIDERMALGMLEEMTECEAATTVNECEDGLGDLMVYASQLCTNNRLAIGPILQLASQLDTLDQKGAKHIVLAYGALAQVVLKGAQKVRGLDNTQKYRLRLVGAVAYAIARCGLMVAAEKADHEADDEIEIDFGRILIAVGGKVTKRGAGHDAIPKLVVH